MRQRLHAAIEPERNTWWGRVKPGSDNSLYRAMERIGALSEQENLLEDFFLKIDHDIKGTVRNPPITFADYKKEINLERLEPFPGAPIVPDDTLLYETSRVLCTQVFELKIPPSIVFLGHTPEYASAEAEDFGKSLLRAFEAVRPWRRAEQDEISRLCDLYPDMPSRELYALARRNVEHLKPAPLTDPDEEGEE